MPVITNLPWIKAPDLAGDYARGLALGVQAKDAAARLSAENTRTQMEAQARSETLKQETLREQARIQTDTAYKQQTLMLQQAKAKEVADEAAAKTKAAANTMAAQHKFASLLAAGVPEDQALSQVPELATATAVSAAQRAKDANAARGMTQAHQDATMALEKQKFKLEQDREARLQAGTDTDTTTTRETFPAVAAEPAVPAGTGLFGTGFLASKGSPAVPGSPARTVTTKTKIGDDNAKLPALPTSPAATAAAPEYKTAAYVRAAFHDGKLTRKEASKILVEQFGKIQ